MAIKINITPCAAQYYLFSVAQKNIYHYFCKIIDTTAHFMQF